MSITSQHSTQRVAIILNGPNDWDEWVGVIKSKAIGNKIWEYINPSTVKDELSILTEPSYPLSANVNPAITDPDKLSGAEKEQLKRLQADYMNVRILPLETCELSSRKPSHECTSHTPWTAKHHMTCLLG